MMVSKSFSIMDVLAFGTFYGIVKTYHFIVLFLKFLHMHGVPTVITSTSFIGFWHMSNEWKV
jgi:hypothetical protein